MPTKARASGTAALRTLRRLCQAVSVSGEEREVRDIIQDELKPHADEIKVDALGNVLVTRKGRGAKRLRSAKGEEGGTSPPINPFLQGGKVLDRVDGGRRIVFDDDYDFRCPREDYLP